MKIINKITVALIGASIGLTVIDTIKITIPSYMFAKYTNGLPTNVKVKASYEDSKHNLWLGTLEHGLWEKPVGSSSFINIITIPNRNSIFAIYQSKDGSLWIGTEVGLYYRSATAGAFSKVESLPTDFQITTIFEDREGDLWIGTKGYGLWEKTPSIEMFIQQTELGAKIPSNCTPSSIYQDENGVLWIGLSGNDYIYYKKSADFSFKSEIVGEWFHSITSMTEYKNHPNHLLITDLYEGLWSLGTDALGEPMKINTGLFGVKDGFNTAYYDKQNNLWLGSSQEQGLWEEINGTDNFTQITSGFPKNGVVNTILEDSDNSMWVGIGSSRHLDNNGLYVSKSGAGYNLEQGAMSTVYNDGEHDWILSNKDITFWARGSNITAVNINGKNYGPGQYCLGGNNYDATDGKYQIKVDYSGGKPSEYYYFGIKTTIVNDLGFTTLSVDKLEQYDGYLFGDKSQKVKVEYVYDPKFAGQAALGMHLKNEYIIDWDKTYYQKLDVSTLDPIGSKISLSQSSENIDKDGLYKLVVIDKLGNSTTYYIQVGGKTKIIPDTANSSTNLKLEAWMIALIAIGSIIGLSIITIMIYYFMFSKKSIFEKHNKTKK